MNKLNKIICALFLILSALDFSNAQQPSFTLKAMNFVYTDSIGLREIDAVKFDLYILHTNQGVSGPFEYALGQYYFNVNGALGVSSEYSYYIIPGSSDFINLNALPRNPTFVCPDASSPSGASLKMNSNAVLGFGNGPIISATSPGTKICTVRFKKRLGSFPLVPLSLNWRLTLPNPFTKIFAHISNQITDISSQGIYSIDTVSSMVSLVNPADNSFYNPVTVTFKWKKFRSSFKYIIKIYKDPLLKDLIFNYRNITDTFKTIGIFNSSEDYYWRVGAEDLSGEIYYSSVRHFTVNPVKYLNVKLIPEGMYYPLFDQLIRRDTVTAFIRQTSFPYNKVDSAKSVIDSISFKGTFKFLNVPPGTYYYAMKHFNSIETWSRSGGEILPLTDTAYYDFTTSLSQAYGNNLKLKNGKYCFFSGDVNQDGIIDATDMSIVDNDSYAGISGRFLRSDLNGNNFVDAADLSVAENNMGVTAVP